MSEQTLRELELVVREHSTYGKLNSPEMAGIFIRERYASSTREHFGVVLLYGRHAVIGFSVVSVGTATASLVHPREVFTLAVRESACAVILWHTHPSGDPKPSVEDTKVTRRLSECGKLLGINVLDHLILGHPDAPI